LGKDPETASLPIRVFHAVPEPSFSAAKNSLPGLYLRIIRHAHDDSSDNAPWKEGRERSERWKEILGKGFLPRVSGRLRIFSLFNPHKIEENAINKLDRGVKIYYRKSFNNPYFNWHKLCIFRLRR